MSTPASTYRELAARAQAEADGATLTNVRDRALRSAAAFEKMALQHDHTTKLRIERQNAAAETAIAASLNAPTDQTEQE